jgi:hypothetical protein
MNGIFSLSKHLESIFHKLWGEWIVWEKEGPKCEQQPSKKWSNPTPSTISIFLGHVTPYSKDDPIQKEFEEDLTLFIAKKLVASSFLEAPLFKRLILKQNPHFNFPLR